MVAIIGDGAMTAGMAFEALNNAGAMDTNLLVVLNDNDMSISENVGALNNYLAKLMSGRFYAAARKTGEKVLGVVPPVLELAKRAEEHVKGMVTPGTLFEEFGFNYIGPIDGHNLDVLVSDAGQPEEARGSAVPACGHAQRQGLRARGGRSDPLSRRDQIRSRRRASSPKPAGKPTYTQIFGDWLCDMAAQDSRLIGITPAMREGSGLVRFSQEYPDRYFDVGIAEQHALTFAAGLACEGCKPVVAIYSTFLQRAYDQLIHDICIQNLPVLFAHRPGRAGRRRWTDPRRKLRPELPALPAEHGGHGAGRRERMPPDAVHRIPDRQRRWRCAIRAASGPGVAPATGHAGVADRQGRSPPPWRKRIAILSFGALLKPCLDAAEKLDATVANMRFVKPLDEDLVRELARGP